MQMPNSQPGNETFLNQNISVDSTSGRAYGYLLNEEPARAQGELPQAISTSFASPWSNPQIALVANTHPRTNRSHHSSMETRAIDAPRFRYRLGRVGNPDWGREESHQVTSISHYSQPSNRQVAMQTANNGGYSPSMEVRGIIARPRHAAVEMGPVVMEERPSNPCHPSLALAYDNPALVAHSDNTQNSSDGSHQRTTEARDIGGRPYRVCHPLRTADLVRERPWVPQAVPIPPSSNAQVAKKTASPQCENNRQVQSGSPVFELGLVNRPIRTRFVNVVARTAKCDVCNKRNAIGMTRCVGCGWQSCHACTLANSCLRTHSAGGSYHVGPISECDLIELPPKAARSSRKRKCEDQVLDEANPAQHGSDGSDTRRRRVRNTKGTSTPTQRDIPEVFSSRKRRVPEDEAPACMGEEDIGGDLPKIRSPAVKRRKPNSRTAENRVSDIDPAHQRIRMPSVNEGMVETELPDGILHDANILLSFSIAAYRETEESQAMVLLEQDSSLWRREIQGDAATQADQINRSIAYGDRALATQYEQRDGDILSEFPYQDDTLKLSQQNENKDHTQASRFSEAFMSPESDLSDNNNNNDSEFELDGDIDSSSDPEDI